MANFGDLLGALSQSRMTELLLDMFFNGPPTITLCHGKIEVPSVEDRLQIIFENHDSLIGGHKGKTKTYRRIRERYTWPGFQNDVHNYIRNCRSCLENKLVRARTHEPIVITVTLLGVSDKVSLDTVGRLSTTLSRNRYILNMQHNFSKLCIAVPIPDIKTETVAHAIAQHLIAQYGTPRCILRDRGESFISRLMRKLGKIFGVKQLTTSGYRPLTNGSLELSHIVLTDYIKHYADGFDDREELLPFAMFAYNTLAHESTNFLPFELLYG